MSIVCPHCQHSGPFSHLLDLRQAIEVELYRDDRGRLQFKIVDDAEAVEEDVADAGFRCERCQTRLSRF
jgi:DNA-directed RNA polymerase subunit RPC12/RpoP